MRRLPVTIVRRSPLYGRRSAAVHYRLTVVVVGYVNVPAGDRELFVGHRRARRRLAAIAVVQQLLLLFVLFRLGRVYVHQRPVFPHGHAGQQHLVTAARLFELPHGLGSLDLFTGLQATAVVGVIVAERRRLSVVAAVTERGQMPNARARSHRRQTGVPSAGCCPSVRSVHRARVRLLLMPEPVTAAAAAATSVPSRFSSGHSNIVNHVCIIQDTDHPPPSPQVP